MSTCYVCLTETTDEADYHPKCLKQLFGRSKLPKLDFDMANLHEAALAMVGHSSLSGVQKKISLGLNKTALMVVAEGGGYILKPQTGTYPSVPENELTTTRLAELVEIESAVSGLIKLTDDSLAFLVRRFDRTVTGNKVHQEDFCQLSEKSPKQKYEGSAELCAHLIKRYASEPLIELLKLYRLMLFTWWSGNGDMHLKNFSLLIDEGGIIKLTPAYDLVATHLVIKDDPLALTVGGMNQNLRRADWLRYAEYCGLPRKTADSVIAKQVDITQQGLKIVQNGFLPDKQKEDYQELIQARTQLLSS